MPGTLLVKVHAGTINISLTYKDTKIQKDF